MFKMGLGFVLLNIMLLVAAFSSRRQPAENNSLNGSDGNSTFYKEGKLKDDLLKGIGNILGRLIGGQSIVCTALGDGTNITLEGTSSGVIFCLDFCS